MQNDPVRNKTTEIDGPHMRRCSQCGRSFKSRKAADDHIQMKHKGIGHRVSAKRPDDEPSMADIVVDAQIAHAAGEPVEDWVKDMFGDYL
jgi:uncharacterized C2H2 Zn-finger protein